MVNKDSSETISEFCLAERFSKSFYYGLKKRGLAPEEFEVPVPASSVSRRKPIQLGASAWPSWQRAKPRSWKLSADAPKPPKPENSQLKARTT